MNCGTESGSYAAQGNVQVWKPSPLTEWFHLSPHWKVITITCTKARYFDKVVQMKLDWFLYCRHTVYFDLNAIGFYLH